MGLDIPKRFDVDKELGWKGLVVKLALSDQEMNQLYKAEEEVDNARRDIRGAQGDVDKGDAASEEAQADAANAEGDANTLNEQGNETKSKSPDGQKQTASKSRETAGAEKESVTNSSSEFTAASDSTNAVFDDNSTALQGWLSEFNDCQTRSTQANDEATAIAEGAAADAEQDFSALSLKTGAEIQQEEQNGGSGGGEVPEPPAEMGRNAEYLQKLQDATAAQSDASAISDKLKGAQSQSDEAAQSATAAGDATQEKVKGSQGVADSEKGKLKGVNDFAIKMVETGQTVANAADLVSDTADVVKGVSYTVSGIATTIGVIGGGVTTTGGIVSAIGAPLCAVFGLGVPVVAAGGTTTGSGVAVGGTAGTIATASRTVGTCADKVSDCADVIYGIGQASATGGEAIQGIVKGVNGDWDGAMEHFSNAGDTAIAAVRTLDKKHSELVSNIGSAITAADDFAGAAQSLAQGDYEAAYRQAWSGFANTLQTTGNNTADMIGTSMEMTQYAGDLTTSIQNGDGRQILANTAALFNGADHLSKSYQKSMNGLEPLGMGAMGMGVPVKPKEGADNADGTRKPADGTDATRRKDGVDVDGTDAPKATRRNDGADDGVDFHEKTVKLIGKDAAETEFGRGIEQLQRDFASNSDPHALDEAAEGNVFGMNTAARKKGRAGDVSLAQDCAQLSAAAYSEKTKKKTFTFGEGDNKRVYEEIDNIGVGHYKRESQYDRPVEESGEGFAARAYKTTGRDGKDTIVVAFRGSDDVADIETDQRLRRGELTAQINSAQYYLEEIKSKHPDATIVVTGHSLGGCEAEMVASLNKDVIGVSFNAVGSKSLVEGHKELGFEDHGNVTAFVTKGDVISNANEHVGSVTVAPVATNSRRGGQYDEHAIQNFTEAETWSTIDTRTEEAFLENSRRAGFANASGEPVGQREYTDGSKVEVLEVDSDGSATNARMLAQGFDNPPFTPGKEVRSVVTTEDMIFVRTMDGQGSGVLGGWIMPKSEIDGLTPEQIADKWALPQVPKFVCDVKVPKGTKLMIGECNPLFGYKGGGTQYKITESPDGNWYIPQECYDNVRRLPKQ